MGHYFIGIGLPTKENKYMSYVKKLFHPKSKLTSPPHITLIPPFYYQNDKELKEKLIAWGKSQEEIRVTFKWVGSFKQRKYGTVFLAPVKGEEIKKIASSLLKNFSFMKIKGQFIPHLTLAQRVGLDNTNEVKKQIRDMKIEVELRVNSVILYQQPNDKGDWRVDSVINFGLK